MRVALLVHDIEHSNILERKDARMLETLALGVTVAVVSAWLAGRSLFGWAVFFVLLVAMVVK
jgi:hypothetical protein